MSRGRKSKSESISQDWRQIFQKNVGAYFQTVIIELGKVTQMDAESGLELFQQIKSERQKLGLKETGLDKITQDEIPFKIPENWVWCRLGDICSKIGSGSTPKGSNYSSSGFPFFRSQNIHNEGLVYSDIKFVSAEVQKQMSGTIVNADDILLNITGGSMGRCSLVPKNFKEGNVSQHVCIIRPLKVDTFFIHKIVLSTYFQKNIFSSTTGSGREGLPKYNLERLIVPLPPLSEQQKIVDFFTDFENNNLKTEGYYFDKEVERKVINLHKSQLLAAENFTLISEQLTLIENLNQAILQEAVQGKLVPQDPTDEPASQLLERIKAEKAKTGKKEKSLPPIKPEEIPFEIPENWVWCRFQEITTLITCGLASTPTYHSTGKIFLSAKNVKPFRFLPNDFKYVDEATYKKVTQNAKPQLNDVLITRVGAGIGETAVIDQDIDFAFYVSLTLVKPIKSGLDSYFLSYWLNSKYGIQNAVEHTSGKGSNQGNLNVNRVRLFLIPLPPLSEQQRIVAEIDKQLGKTKELKAHIIANQQATEQLLKALLHGAFEVEEKEKKIV